MMNQAPEYTASAVRVIANVPDRNGNTMLYKDDAERIVAALQVAGWALVTDTDFDAMTTAYALQEIR